MEKVEIKRKTIITGASGSMGAAATEALAARGIPVIMACRNLEKAAAVRADILTRVPDAQIEIRPLELSSLASVRAFAASVQPGEADAIFNNAGVIPRHWALTEEGFETSLCVNHLAPLLLTQLLIPRLGPGASVVNMVSLTCRLVSVSEATLHPTEEHFTQLGNYARAKRCFLHASRELALRHPEVRVNVADPGVVDSQMLTMGHWYDSLADVIFRPFCKSPSSGVQPALRALSSPLTGYYFRGKTAKPIPGRYCNPQLWEASQALLTK